MLGSMRVVKRDIFMDAMKFERSWRTLLRGHKLVCTYNAAILYLYDAGKLLGYCIYNHKDEPIYIVRWDIYETR